MLRPTPVFAVADAYLVVGVAAVVGAIGGALLSFLRSRYNWTQPQPPNNRSRAMLRVLLAAYSVLVLGMLGAMVAIAGLEETGPYVLMALIIGVSVALTLSRKRE